MLVMSDEVNMNNPELESMGKQLDETIENNPELKEAFDNIPKPDEEELADIFTNEDGSIGDEEFNPEDMAGLDELQNFFKLFGGAGNGLLDKPQVIFQKIDPTATLPEYAHPGDAGMDICSIENITIPVMQRKLIHTGLRARIPEGLEIQVRPRSGLALKHGITVLNTPGTIDSGYRGEIGVILANFGDKEFNVRKGDRVAQLVVSSFVSVRVLEGDVDKDETDRGEGGFGSTGVSEGLNKEEPTNGTEEQQLEKTDENQ